MLAQERLKGKCQALNLFVHRPRTLGLGDFDEVSAMTVPNRAASRFKHLMNNLLHFPLYVNRR